MKMRLAAIVFLLSGCLGVARADMVIDFRVAGTGGSVNFNGGTSNPLTGTNIVIDQITATGVPNNAGVYACSGCVLNFTTGTYMSFIPTGGGAGIYQFNGGGPITLTGSVFLDGTHNIVNQILLTGTFTGTQYVYQSSSTFRIASSMFGDTKNATMMNFFGAPANTQWSGDSGVNFNATGKNGAALQSTSVTGGSVTNSAPVPDGGWTLVFLGSALFGIETLRRKLSV